MAEWHIRLRTFEAQNFTLKAISGVKHLSHQGSFIRRFRKFNTEKTKETGPEYFADFICTRVYYCQFKLIKSGRKLFISFGKQSRIIESS